MPDPFPPSQGSLTPPSATWVASRLQARFEGLEDDDRGERTSGIEPGAVRTPGTTPQGFSRTTDKNAQRQIDDLLRQLDILRNQLDAAFDEYDQRLEGAETRASVAEARASVAETRAADAEARANLAHTRIDEALAYQEEAAAPVPPAAGEEQASPTLRNALSRLRDRLDVAP